jgi:large subunit ribosomal protein L15
MAIVNQSIFKRTTKDRKRVCRGYSGTGGGTGGRGDKGQKSRSGVSGIRVFEGGQTPIYRTLPIRGGGSECYKREVVNEITISRLVEIQAKNGLSKIDKNIFVDLGIIRFCEDKVKVIGSCDAKLSFDVECDYVSKGALALFEKNNHKVVFLESNPAN